MAKEKNIYIIAEAGINHNGSKKIAMEMVDAAVNAGANAIKFQTFNTSLLVTNTAQKAEYQKQNTKDSNSQYTMLKKLELSKNEFVEIFNYCTFKKIDFLSTAFDFESLNFLKEKLNLDTFKISSADLTNTPLLLEHALKAKKIILSTGMSSSEDIEIALGVLSYGFLGKKTKPSLKEFTSAFKSAPGKKILKDRVVLLHCTSSYPSPLDEINLRVMLEFKKKYNLKVGYSDHSNGIIVPLVAASLGANIIEKHFTMSKKFSGPDHKASLEPNELEKMISEIRLVENILGDKEKKITKSELINQKVVRKSLVALKPIKKGEKYTTLNIGCKRPGKGLDPINYWNIIGKTSSFAYKVDDFIKSI